MKKEINLEIMKIRDGKIEIPKHVEYFMTEIKMEVMNDGNMVALN